MISGTSSKCIIDIIENRSTSNTGARFIPEQF